MASQSWVNLLNAGIPWQTTQGTALSTAVSATISPQAPGSHDFVLPGQPGGLQWYPGMQLRIKARGAIASGSTTSNLTVWVAIGVDGTLATALCTTAAIALGTTSVTGEAFMLDADIVCSAIGSTGNTLVSDGIFKFGDTATPAFITANTVTVPMPFLSTAFNTSTTGTAIGLRASLNAAFGSIQCNRFTVEQLN